MRHDHINHNACEYAGRVFAPNTRQYRNRIIVLSIGTLLAGLLIPVLCSAEPSVTPPPAGLGNEPLAAGNLLRITLGLVVVLVAIVATAWGLRRWGHFRSSPQGELQVIGGLSMGPRERLVLVKVGQEQILLGVAPGRIQALHVLQQPLPIRVDNPDNKSFAERMRTAVKQGISS